MVEELKGCKPHPASCEAFAVLVAIVHFATRTAVVPGKSHFGSKPSGELGDDQERLENIGLLS